MKSLRNMAVIALIAASLSACGNSENKSIGGSSDTSNTSSAEGVSSVGGVDSMATDSAGMDTASQGNATPSGRP